MKRIFSLCLIIGVLLSLNTVVYGYNEYEFKMSESGYNLCSGLIDNNTLYLDIKNEKHHDLCIVEIDDKQIIVEDKAGWFYGEFSLNEIQKSHHLVNIYSGNKDDDMFYSFLFYSFNIEYDNGWKIKESSFNSNNERISEEKLNNSYTILPVNSSIKKLAKEIIGENYLSTEETAAILYKWVVENIAYDEKNFNLNRVSYNAPDDVIKNHRAVCYGIAQTYRALCHSQNIPCIVQVGNLHTENGVLPHAWNEIFVNGKWYFVDCTQDVMKHYYAENQYQDTPNSNVIFEFFMCDLNNISDKYEYQSIDTFFDTLYDLGTKYTYNAWVEDEFINSIYYGLFDNTIENGLSGSFARPITRSQFCTLLVRYIMVQMQDTAIFNMSQDAVLSEMNNGIQGMPIPFISEFDSITSEIAFCYKHGIVKGKTENYFGVNDNITRQEAATMLVRAMQYLNSVNSNFRMSNNQNIRFADDNLVGDWAKANVSIVNDMGVMNGIGDNKFNPQGQYTIEQTIATLHRLYRYNLYNNK